MVKEKQEDKPMVETIPMSPHGQMHNWRVVSTQGDISSPRKERRTDTCHRHRRSHMVGFHLYEVCRTGKSAETERRSVVARGWRQGLC